MSLGCSYLPTLYQNSEVNVKITYSSNFFETQSHISLLIFLFLWLKFGLCGCTTRTRLVTFDLSNLQSCWRWILSMNDLYRRFSLGISIFSWSNITILKCKLFYTTIQFGSLLITLYYLKLEWAILMTQNHLWILATHKNCCICLIE